MQAYLGKLKIIGDYNHLFMQIFNHSFIPLNLMTRVLSLLALQIEPYILVQVRSKLAIM